MIQMNWRLVVVGVALLHCTVLLAQPREKKDGITSLDTVLVDRQAKAVRVKRIGLYDGSEQQEKQRIRDFSALDLFTDDMGNEIWKTENSLCINSALSTVDCKEGTRCMKINWDKAAGGCSWVGMGFGWDGWSGKNLASVIDTAAIQFYVRSQGLDLYNLPLALGIEDHSNRQTWIGFSPGFIENGVITRAWTKVTIPLQLFNFDEEVIDASSIKQLIVQFEAAGSIDIDAMHIVPFNGKLRASVAAQPKNTQLSIDGKLDANEWKQDFSSINRKHSFALQFDENNLYIAVQVNDPSPLINTKEGKDIWNGDAIELAIGVNPKADPKRKYYLLSDLQLGIRMNDKPLLWNWKTNKEVPNFTIAVQKTATGYCAEFVVPLAAISQRTLTAKEIHGFEIAIDQANETGTRTHQDRWNSSSSEGFNTNPSVWGEMVLGE